MSPSPRRSSRPRRRSIRSRRRRGGCSARAGFFPLWLAQFFSSLGDWVGFFAILAHHRARSRDSAAAFSLVMGARMLPGFFLATLGGVIVDRFDRRKVMVCCDLGRAALICDAAVRRQPLAARGRLVPHRDPHAAVGAGEGRVGAELRARGEARVGEHARRSSRPTARSRSARRSSPRSPGREWLGGFDALSLAQGQRERSRRSGSTRSPTSSSAVHRLRAPDPEAGASDGRRSSSGRRRFREIKDGFSFMRDEPLRRGGDGRPRRRAHRRRAR